MSEEQTQPEVSPVEQEAISLGWQPKDQFESDPKNEGKKWRSAEDFLDRKPLFDKIDQQGRELKDVKKALQHLANQNKMVEELAYKKAIEELKAQKKQALEEGEHALVVEIDDRIADLKTAAVAPPIQPQQSQPHPEFQRWVDRNEWYVKDTKLRNIADGIGLSLAREGKPPQEIMQEVEQQIKNLYPDRFGMKRVPPNPEGTGSRKSSGGSPEAMLSPEEKRIMNTIVATGVSKDEYLKQFVAINPERFKGVKL